MLHIPQLKPWSLVEVLTQKYDWTFEKARSFAAFLLPMLSYEPSERATAEQCLKHHWVRGVPLASSNESKSQTSVTETITAENGDSSKKVDVTLSKLLYATKEKTILKTSGVNKLTKMLGKDSGELLAANNNLLTNSSDFAVKTNEI